jgi:hypothetical protein
MKSLFTPQEVRIIAFVSAMFLLGLAVRQCRNERAKLPDQLPALTPTTLPDPPARPPDDRDE